MHFIQLQFPELTRTIRDHSFNTCTRTISGKPKFLKLFQGIKMLVFGKFDVHTTWTIP